VHAQAHLCCVDKYICQPYDAAGTKLITSIMKSYCGILHGVLVLCVYVCVSVIIWWQFCKMQNGR